MRTIPDLLKVMLENQELFYYGLCQWVNTLRKKCIIETCEWGEMREYISKNRPDKNDTVYYWDIGHLKPRLDWINQQIEKFETETK